MREILDTTTPVLVLRSPHHGGLGIVRTLGRLGVPVYCVDKERWTPAFHSRYCRGHFVFDFENEPVERALARLLEIGDQLGGRPVLIPTTDTSAIWVAEHDQELRAGFRFPRQDANLVRTLCDKGRMQELAARNGIPVVRSIVPRSQEDVLKYLESAVFPVIVKATDAERMRRRVGATKVIVHSSAELLDLFTKAQDGEGPNFLIQEFIPGEDWMFDGYFDHQSRYLFGATGKKIRRFPAKTGVTSLGVCMRNETVERMTVEFMKAIGYHGILDIGYRLDHRDGKYRVLDANPRIGCTFRLFTGAVGLDVARALYRDLTGQPVHTDAAAEGRKWIVEDFDLFSAMRSFLDGDLTVSEWAKSVRGIDEAACFALDDPAPLLMIGTDDWREWYRWIGRGCGAGKLEHPAPETAKTLQNIGISSEL